MLASIKARIVLFYLLILLVTLSLMGGILYYGLSRIVYASVDSALLAKAKALATLIAENDRETEFQFSDDVMWEYSSPKSTSFFQIRRADGTTLEKSASLGNAQLPYHPGEGPTDFKTIMLKGNPVRQIAFPIPKEAGNGEKGRGIVIQCAEDIRDQTAILNHFALVLAVSVLFIMIMSAGGGFFIARKALRPIQEISGAIDRISEINLSERIAEQTIPDELKGIAASFNRTFASLERAFTRQRQFVADASHELKTPLAVIVSHAEITLRREREPWEYRTALAAIREAARMMSLIIEKLLVLTRLTTDKFGLKREDVSLNDMIAQAVKLLRPLAEGRGIGIYMPAGEEYRVHGDRDALLEALVNILDNAIQYNVPDGRIDISLRKEDEYIVADVADTGIGIPEGELEKVFDRFYRVDKSRSRRSGGSGLGLSITREIVRLHGGKIGISSKTGEGTVVSVRLMGERHWVPLGTPLIN